MSTWTCRICIFLCAFSAAAEAAVARVETTETAAIFPGYERVKGKVFFALDPRHARNRDIVDIAHAPKNDAGRVEFWADFEILRPSDDSRGNRTILFEVVNRGKKGMLQVFNRAAGSPDSKSLAEFGDRLLMEDGYTLVWLGWQHDVPQQTGLMRVGAPAAKGIKGLVRAEFTPATPVTRFSLGDSNHIPYKPLDGSAAVLTVRDSIYGPRKTLASGDWRFENGTAVVLNAPAQPGKLYEIVYESADPAIAGLGLAGIRDFISHLRREGRADHAIAFGVSQSAMVLRAFLHEGFNQDESGSKVFDGIFSHVAGGRRSTFQRFAQPSRTAGPLRNASLSTTEQPPFTDRELLARAHAANVEPKLLVTNSTYEYWGSAASLLHTSVDGSRDLDLPRNIRMYVFAGGQHGPAAFPPRPTGGRNLPNFNDYRWSLRALLGSLRAWVVNGTEPPASVYPTLAAGTLTPVDRYAVRDIRRPTEIHSPHLLDFGPDYAKQGIITKEPPRVVRSYRTLVPQADADGNDLGGVRMPEVECAIASYTGWNLRGESIGNPEYLLSNTGSYLPFELGKIQQKFPNKESYLACVEKSASSLADRKFLLRQDVKSFVDAAARHWSWRMETRFTSSLQSRQ